jgi:formate/nitrite transporter FocA (FNT family)
MIAVRQNILKHNECSRANSAIASSKPASASRAARIPIVSLTYVVGLSGLTHVVVGSVGVPFLVMIGIKSWLSFLTAYMLPTPIGNTLGGVSLASALNHAQVIAGPPKAARISRI